MVDTPLKDLLSKYFYKTATVDEQKVLFELLEEDIYKEQVLAIMAELYAGDWDALEDIDFNRQVILEEILSSYSERKVVPWKKWAAYSASIVLVLGIWFFIQKDGTNRARTELVQTQDIPAGGNKAILTLDNGTKIILDSLSEGSVLEEGSIRIVKSDDGQLTYEMSSGDNTVLTYNTIKTPTGGFYQVILPDGTHVWLNAESSLRFPTMFKGPDRKVELTGEGYFEVAKNAEQPFIVSVGETQVKVLGTHFNVNAYALAKGVNTTVLEGRVAVGIGETVQHVNPGQQLKWYKNRPAVLLENVDLSQEVAWKHGYFCQNSIPLRDLMEEVKRWYGVQVEYEAPINPEFVIRIRKDVSLGQLLTVLELTGEVKFNLTNKTLKVMEAKHL